MGAAQTSSHCYTRSYGAAAPAMALPPAHRPSHSYSFSFSAEPRASHDPCDHGGVPTAASNTGGLAQLPSRLALGAGGQTTCDLADAPRSLIQHLTPMRDDDGDDDGYDFGSQYYDEDDAVSAAAQQQQQQRHALHSYVPARQAAATVHAPATPPAPHADALRRPSALAAGAPGGVARVQSWTAAAAAPAAAPADAALRVGQLTGRGSMRRI